MRLLCEAHTRPSHGERREGVGAFAQATPGRVWFTEVALAVRLVAPAAPALPFPQSLVLMTRLSPLLAADLLECSQGMSKGLKRLGLINQLPRGIQGPGSPPGALETLESRKIK
jgi:hypothetical protein